MYGALKFIGEHFSGYAILLIFLCSYTLIFIDGKQLKANDLKKEAAVSLISGIIYTALGIILFIITRFFVPIR